MPKALALRDSWRPWAGVLLAWLVRLWVRSWRVCLVGEGLAVLDRTKPVVFTFWHGQQLALVSAAQQRASVRRLATLVSWSRDGLLQASVMQTLGLRVVRGSSSRGAVAGLRGMVKSVQQGCDAAFAVDGPRGPRGTAKPGALLVAKRTQALLVPVATAAQHYWVLKRAWDAFEVPLPFTRVMVVLGPALNPAQVANVDVLSLAIHRARERATRQLGETSRLRSNTLPLLAAHTKRGKHGSAGDDRRAAGG